MDLQFRRRRIAVATVGASLVLGLGLVVSGFSASFRNEASRTISALDASQWAVPSGSSGPFWSFEPTLATDAAAAVLSGEAGGVLVSRANLGDASDPTDAILIGVEPGRPGSPTSLDAGRPLSGPGEIVVSSRFGFWVGQVVSAGGVSFEIVGEIDATLGGGQPLAVVSLSDAQAIAAQGLPIVTALALDAAGEVGGDFRVLDLDEVRDDTLRPLRGATSTIALITLLLWVVAAMIVGSVLYLNTLERTTDIAVFKAIGVPGRHIAAGTFLQAAVVAVAASVLAIVIALSLAPLFPLRTEIARSDAAILPVVALGVSFIGALAGVRRTVMISPAVAFGGP